MPRDRAQDPPDSLDVSGEGRQALLKVLAVTHVCQDPVKPGDGRRVRLSCTYTQPMTFGCLTAEQLPAWPVSRTLNMPSARLHQGMPCSHTPTSAGNALRGSCIYSTSYAAAANHEGCAYPRDGVILWSFQQIL